MTGRRATQAAIIGAVLSLAVAAGAQTCDDFDGCTVNDMCSAGTCQGTPQSGGACDDFDDCTVNDRCTNDPFLPCRGDPAPVGTSCSGGCGECQEIGPGVLTCGSAGSTGGEPCDPGLGPCLVGTCQVFQGGLVVACIPALKECPDTDGNPCTDACGENGECQVNAPKCVPNCERCNPETGACEPANEGISCDDFDPCSPDSRCEATDIGGGMTRGFCLPGVSTPGSTTPTATTPTVPVGVTPTATEPSGPTPTVGPIACVGDCNDNGVVAINELIIGVNIALGSSDISTCESFDTNGNDTVDINELISGVNALIAGCA